MELNPDSVATSSNGMSVVVRSVLGAADPPTVYVFVEGSVELLIEIIGDVSAVGAYCHRQFDNIQFGAEIDSVVLESLAEPLLKLVVVRLSRGRALCVGRECIIGSNITRRFVSGLSIDSYEGTEHILLTVNEIAEKTEESHDKDIVDEDHSVGNIYRRGCPHDKQQNIDNHYVLEPIEGKALIGKVHLQPSVELVDSYDTVDDYSDGIDDGETEYDLIQRHIPCEAKDKESTIIGYGIWDYQFPLTRQRTRQPDDDEQSARHDTHLEDVGQRTRHNTMDRADEIEIDKLKDGDEYQVEHEPEHH